MSGLAALRKSDPYRVVLLALGPGLIAATVSSVLFGYGADAANLVLRVPFTYALLLLWSLPALPMLGLAVVRWMPRRPRITMRGPLPLAAVLVAPLWHVFILELMSWRGVGETFLQAHWAELAAAYVPGLAVTLAGWAIYLATRRNRSSPARPETH